MTLIDRLVLNWTPALSAAITAHLDRTACEACACGDLALALDASRTSKRLKNLTANQPPVSTVRDSVRAEV